MSAMPPPNPETPPPHMLLPGGQERTPEEYAELPAKAKFRMERVVPTASPVGVVEAVEAVPA